MSRIVDIKDARKLKCSLCLYSEKTKKRKRYKCGAYRDVATYMCKFDVCPYEENTLKT